MMQVSARLKTITASIELITEECPSCGIVFAWPSDFHRNIRKSGGRLKGYCPNGHAISWRESEADKLRRERDRLKQQLAYKDDRIKAADDRAQRERNRANGYKGHATKITKRAKAGVCPCCNRTFKQLAAHMKSQHPTFTPIEIDEGEAVNA